MGVILDTSALIGWAERRNPAVEDYILTSGERPLLHHVTLGELHTGIARAVVDGLADEVIAARRRTLAIAERFEIVGFGDPAVFGAIAAQASRKVSHNDMWITAAAIEKAALLVTEDEALHVNVAGREWAAMPGWKAQSVYVGA